jgi:hypothetical protein
MLLNIYNCDDYLLLLVLLVVLQHFSSTSILPNTAAFLLSYFLSAIVLTITVLAFCAADSLSGTDALLQCCFFAAAVTYCC